MHFNAAMTVRATGGPSAKTEISRARRIPPILRAAAWVALIPDGVTFKRCATRGFLQAPRNSSTRIRQPVSHFLFPP